MDRATFRRPSLRTVVAIIVAWSVVPLIVLAAAEFTLRAIGWGQSTKPFLEAHIDGKDYEVLNMAFMTQFFPMWPDSISYEPYHVVIPKEKPPNTFRVAVFGSSAAFGCLFPELGLPRVLESLLRAQCPGKNIEVHSLAWHGMNSHVMRLLAKAAAPLDFDLFIVYTGNNEVKGTLAVLYDMRSILPTPLLAETYARLSNLRLMQAMVRGIGYFWTPPRNLRRWEADIGYQTMNDPKLQRVLNNYDENLERICETAIDANTAVILSTVAANLRTFRPLSSSLSPCLDPAATGQWNDLFERGKALEETGDFAGALAAYDSAAHIDASHADLQFRIGTCCYALGECKRAKVCFQTARDQDFSLITATSRTNAVVAAVAQRRAEDGVMLVDAAAKLADASPCGIPGDEFFEDHCHLMFEGTYQIARAIVEELGRVRPEPLRDVLRDNSEIPSLEKCEERMAVTPVLLGQQVNSVLTRRNWGEMKTGSYEYFQERKRALEQELSGANPNEVEIEAGKRAVALDPDSFFVRNRYFHALLGMGRGPELEAQANELVARFPYLWYSQNALAAALSFNGKKIEAMAVLEKLCASYPWCPESHMSYGNLLRKLGQLEDAVTAYRRAASLRKVNDLARIAEAETLLQMGDREGAIHAAIQAVYATPDQEPQYERVDRLLQQDPVRRAAVWRKVARRHSDIALPRVYLGMALEQSNDPGRAADAYRTALGVDPNSAQAKAGLARVQAEGATPSR